MKVPFGHIKISKKTRKLINKTLKENKVSQGENVEKFENEFAKFVGTKHAVAMNSGSSALIAALSVINKDDRKEIIVPALSFPASFACIVHSGYKPIPVDIELDTLNIDFVEMKNKIRKNTRGILPVHLMGKSCNMTKILESAVENNIIVIEDGCEALGSEYKKNKVGTLGDIAVFSCYTSHSVISIEGGMAVTNSDKYYNKLRRIRNHGRKYDIPAYSKYVVSNGDDKRFIFDQIGFNFKMNEIEAIVGLESLKKIDNIIKKRRNNFLYYQNEFGELEDFFYRYKENSNEYIVPHAFPIVLKPDVKFSRNQFMKYLTDENGIDCRTLFQSISSINAYGIEEKFPVAEHVEKNGLHIGVHPGIKEKDREYVINIIKKFLEAKG